MASRKLSDLEPDTREKVYNMKEASNKAGFSFLIYCTYRDFVEQAKLFREGRTLAKIMVKVDELDRKWNRPDLSQILIDVGPQMGDKIKTYAGPGQSNHHYHLALDGCPMVGGKPVWSKKDPLWQTYGKIAMASGLEWAGTWRSFKEFPHLQAPDANWRDFIREGAQ